MDLICQNFKKIATKKDQQFLCSKLKMDLALGVSLQKIGQSHFYSISHCIQISMIAVLFFSI